MLHIRGSVFFLLLLCSVLFFAIVTRTSPNHDEAANIVAGLFIWKYGQFDLYSVNPPLPKMIASFPLLFWQSEVEWKVFDEHLTQNKAGSRPEFSLGLGFVRANLDNLCSYLIAARLMCFPFMLLGAYFCWLWAKELYGEWAGLTALTLWCFCPNVLTWGSMVMPDVPAASFGIMAGYFFWKWLKNSDYHNAFIAGVTLGLALLTKLTWIFLLPLFPVVWFIWYISKEKDRTWFSLRDRLGKVLFILVAAVFTLNLGYGFEGTFTRLGDFRFASRTLAGKNSVVDDRTGGNRFAETPLAHIPVPLPKNYVLGADLQKVDFEKGLPSYLFGKWQDHGWWYYYIVCAALKIPLGTWGLGLLVICFSIAGVFYRRKDTNSASWCDQLVLLAPAVVLFVFVSSQTGFSRHFRYVLPALPFAYIWISQVAQIAVTRRSLPLKTLVAGLITWSVISSLSVYPHSMSYFNELAGGSKNGHKYLLDSNIDWGQDVFHLQEWIKKHPEANDLHLILRDDIAEAFFLSEGYPVVPLAPGKPIQTISEEDTDPRKLAPCPGWFAASIHQINAEHGRYKYLLDFEPLECIGYSIYIYNISLNQANAARKRYGLPEILAPQNDPDQFKARFSKNISGENIIKIALFYTDKHDENATKDLERILNADTRCSWKPITAVEIKSERLNDFDVIIFPGGNAREQANALGAAGKMAIRDFVEQGGGYVGICAGGFLATTNTEYGISLANVKARAGYRHVPNEGLVSMTVRGSGEVTVQWTHEGKELLGDSLTGDSVQFSSGPIFSPAYRKDLDQYIVLADYTSEVAMYDFQKDEMIRTPTIILAPYGKGIVVLCGAHFEFSEQYDQMIKKLIRGVSH